MVSSVRRISPQVRTFDEASRPGGVPLYLRVFRALSNATGRTSRTSGVRPPVSLWGKLLALQGAGYLGLVWLHLSNGGAEYVRTLARNGPIVRGAFEFSAAASAQSTWLIQLLLLAYLFAIYVISLQKYRPGQLSPRQTLWLAAGLGALNCLILPRNSLDVFTYVGFGRLAAVYHLNPYVSSYSDIADFYAPYSWGGHMFYGPAILPFVMIAGIISESSILAAIVSLKVVSLALVIASGWLVGRLRGRRGWDPAFGMLVFVSNPLLLFELIGHGHNDGLIILFVVAALYLLTIGREALALAIALLAGFVKLPGLLPFLAIVAYLLRRRCWMSLACGSLFCGLLLGAAMPLFPNREALLPLLAPTHQRAGLALTQYVLGGAAPGGILGAFQALQGILIPVLGGFCLWRLTRVVVIEDVIRESAHTTLAVLVAYSAVVYPWYITWLLPFAALVNSAPLRRGILAYSFTALGIYHLHGARIGELFERTLLLKALRRAIIHGPALGALVAGLRGGGDHSLIGNSPERADRVQP